MKITGHVAAITLLTAMQPQAALADNKQAIEFQIPAQNLSSALLEFSENSGVRTFFKADIARNLESKGLSGKFTPQQALDKLLENTGVNYRFTESESVTLSSDRSELSTEMLLAMAPNEEVVADARNNEDYSGPVEQEDLTVSGQALSGYSVVNANSATRTDTPVMELPQSIQMIPRKLLDDQQSITVSESLRNVSGVVPRNPLVSPNNEITLIRGFDSVVMVDGFYQNLNSGDQGSLVNIQQIDVLKGANATMYSGGGGSPVGGVVNLVSKRPEKEAFYEMGMKGGSYDFYQPYVDLNQPINDNILFRVTGEYTNNESHIDTIETERYNINPTLVFTDNDKTTFTVQGKYSSWEQQDYQGLPATGSVTGSFNIDPELYIGPDDIEDSTSEFYAVWGTLEHDFNDIWSVTAKARYAHSKIDQLAQIIAGGGSDMFGADEPFFASTWALANVELYQEQEEVSFQAYTTAKFDIGPTRNTFMMGMDYTEEDEDQFMDAPAFNGFVDLNNPTFSTPFQKPGPGKSTEFIKQTTVGGYLQLQSSFYERLHVLAALRWGNIETHYDGAALTSDTSETRFLPNVGGVLDLTDEISLFANYSEGMRAQGSTQFSSAPVAELSYQKEVGLKVNLADQLTGQVSVYQIDRENVAVRDLSGFGSVANGVQRSQGIETNMAWQATEGLSFLANYTYTDAQFTADSDVGTGTIKKGNQLAGVPTHSGRFWTNYAFQQPELKGLSIGAGIYTQSAVYLSNQNKYMSDSYHSVDATVSYDIDRYHFGVSAKNLTNEDYFDRLNYFGTRTAPSQGASVYFTGSVRF